tara:strand:- start:13048 stop:13815 length:768 start_codon:yes stop_codon:yes gene_type:complete
MKLIIIFTLIFYSNYFNNDWGSTGHRVVGKIAEQNISNETRKKIFDLLDGNSIAYVSTYADEIKSNSTFKNYNNWHYANLKLHQKYKTSKKNPKGDVYFGIKKCIDILNDNTISKKEKQFYLKLLIHLIGDLHQPLHLGKKEDRGGNDIKIKWFDKFSNLHRVWDSNMINYSRLSYSELANNLPAVSDKVKKQIISAPIEKWFEETHNLTKYIYNKLPKDKILGYKYYHENFDIIRLQLLKAGLRLAYTLDQIFK